MMDEENKLESIGLQRSDHFIPEGVHSPSGGDVSFSLTTQKKSPFLAIALFQLC